MSLQKEKVREDQFENAVISKNFFRQVGMASW